MTTLKGILIGISITVLAGLILAHAKPFFEQSASLHAYVYPAPYALPFNARTQFGLANQATAAESATKDPALQNLSNANTYYNAATGEMLLLILERIERLHHKIDRMEKKLG